MFIGICSRSQVSVYRTIALFSKISQKNADIRNFLKIMFNFLNISNLHFFDMCLKNYQFISSVDQVAINFLCKPAYTAGSSVVDRGPEG